MPNCNVRACGASLYQSGKDLCRAEVVFLGRRSTPDSQLGTISFRTG